MGVPVQSLEGIFEHKLDTKYRVSMPAAWRPAKGETVQLRLLRWKHMGVPVLKALTNEAFEAMIESINEDAELSSGQKSAKKGLIYSLNESAHVNDQGKLAIPKKLAEEQGIEAGEPVHLFGRGTNFDLVSPRDVDALRAAEAKVLENLYDTVDFG
ncbi:MAG: hypothetical protein AAGC74_03180 [Verrucomicrobiota bacterium]